MEQVSREETRFSPQYVSIFHWVTSDVCPTLSASFENQEKRFFKEMKAKEILAWLSESTHLVFLLHLIKLTPAQLGYMATQAFLGWNIQLLVFQPHAHPQNGL